MFAVASLLVVVLVTLIVTRIATIALVLTGMTPQAASFQSRSALTGTGFATKESEQVVNHPGRRRIIQTLMLTGNAGLATTIAGLSVSLVGTESVMGGLQRIGLLVAGLLVILLLARSEVVGRVVTRIIERLLARYTSLDVSDYGALLHLGGDFEVQELFVRDDHWTRDRPLSELQLTREGLVVLGIERASKGVWLGAPTAETVVHAGDRLIVYGSRRCLEDLAHRPSGVEGDVAHLRNVSANLERVARERALDPEI